MTTTLLRSSPLRLPEGEPRVSATLFVGGLRGCLEDLNRRGFGGRLALAADDWRAELLLWSGRLLAATFSGPGTSEPRRGSAALTTLLEHGDLSWVSRLEALDEDILQALAGIGTEPESTVLAEPDHLRALLRDLVEQRQDGVLELSAAGSWARVLLAHGRLLGAYVNDRPVLTPSLAALGELLLQPSPDVRWYPSVGAVELELPAAPVVKGVGASEVERQVVWIVSRFEGAWSRARESGRSLDELEAVLVQMAAPLQWLAGELEAADDPATLEASLQQLGSRDVTPTKLADLDPRLHGLDARQTCPVLVELILETLRRIVAACPDENLAEVCRQAARALENELRRAFPTSTATSNRYGANTP